MARVQRLLSSIASTFYLEDVYFFFFWLSTASTQRQTFVNEYRLSRVRFPCRLCTSPQTATPLCPPFVSPLCLSPLLPLWSLAWKEFFDCVRLCSQGREICLKIMKKKMKKGKRRNRFYMHMYVFVCQCSGAPHTQIPVILLLLSRLYK